MISPVTIGLFLHYAANIADGHATDAGTTFGYGVRARFVKSGNFSVLSYHFSIEHRGSPPYPSGQAAALPGLSVYWRGPTVHESIDRRKSHAVSERQLMPRSWRVHFELRLHEGVLPGKIAPRAPFHLRVPELKKSYHTQVYAHRMGCDYDAVNLGPQWYLDFNRFESECNACYIQPFEGVRQSPGNAIDYHNTNIDCEEEEKVHSFGQPRRSTTFRAGIRFPLWQNIDDDCAQNSTQNTPANSPVPGVDPSLRTTYCPDPQTTQWTLSGGTSNTTCSLSDMPMDVSTTAGPDFQPVSTQAASNGCSQYSKSLSQGTVLQGNFLHDYLLFFALVDGWNQLGCSSRSSCDNSATVVVLGSPLTCQQIAVEVVGSRLACLPSDLPTVVFRQVLVIAGDSVGAQVLILAPTPMQLRCRHDGADLQGQAAVPVWAKLTGSIPPLHYKRGCVSCSARLPPPRGTRAPVELWFALLQGLQ